METAKKHFKSIVLFGCSLALVVFVLNGCKKSEPQSSMTSVESMKESAEPAKEAVTAAVEQTTCPVMDGNKIDKNVFVEYKGKKVYFCCLACKAKFLAEPEKYLAKLPQFKP
jgi:YHS domain-containing protein